MAVRSEYACSLSTLGSFAFTIQERIIPSPPTQKARALLAYLILHRHNDVARERLLDLFWPDADPARARDSLNTALHSIRRCFRSTGLEPDDFLFANKTIVRWTVDVDIDIEHFDADVDTSDETSIRALSTTYRGEFLEGDYEEWTVIQRERVAAQYERLLSHAVRLTKDPQFAKRLLSRNPYDEDAYAALIESELSAGKPFNAMRIADRCRTALAEIGIKPSESFFSKFGSLAKREHTTP